MSFLNKVVIVTGASSGIGAATAILFAKEGANVVLVGRNVEKLQNVYEKCVKFGNKSIQIRADISNDEDAKRIIEKTIEIFGKLDVLINNAGLVRFAKIEDDDIMEVFDTILNTNLRAQVHLTHLAIPYLIKTKGNIVNVSSISGTLPPATKMIAYGTSKAALNHFTRGAAAEFAAHGVRVNTVSPGPVKTDVLLNAGISDPLEKLYPTPLQRISEPHEIGDLILFLASDKARAITGSEFVSDNGYMLKR
ncbi:unnamed protein product, partial [Brenthis ino]